MKSSAHDAVPGHDGAKPRSTPRADEFWAVLHSAADKPKTGASSTDHMRPRGLPAPIAPVNMRSAYEAVLAHDAGTTVLTRKILSNTWYVILPAM